MNFIAVFVGGGLGCLARYLLYLYISKPDELLPWSTLTANVVSSLILGALLAGMAPGEKQNIWYLLLATGFCGGFSTFSTFSAENFQLLHQGLLIAALGNVMLNVILCLVAIFVGYRGFTWMFTP